VRCFAGEARRAALGWAALDVAVIDVAVIGWLSIGGGRSVTSA
jgi:hypothetical protein